MYFEVDGSRTFCSNGSGKLAPEQPSLVFIHGAGLDHSTFVLPARYFARRHFNVYALDLPGHGRSQGQALDSIAEMAQWVRRVTLTLEIQQPALVGYSMGSLVALQFAATWPDALRALILAGTAVPMPVSDGLLDAARDNSHLAIDMANTWSHSRYAQLGGNENPGVSMMMSGQRLLEEAAPDVFFRDLKACNEFGDSLGLARQVTVPTLLLMGAADQMTAPVNALQVADNIADCRVERLERCGHAMFAERPNEVLDALITAV